MPESPDDLLQAATNIRLVPVDGSEGSVTVHLPMGAEKFAKILMELGKLGFGFEHEAE